MRRREVVLPHFYDTHSTGHDAGGGVLIDAALCCRMGWRIRSARRTTEIFLKCIEMVMPGES